MGVNFNAADSAVNVWDVGDIDDTADDHLSVQIAQLQVERKTTRRLAICLPKFSATCLSQLFFFKDPCFSCSIHTREIGSTVIIWNSFGIPFLK